MNWKTLFFFLYVLAWSCISHAADLDFGNGLIIEVADYVNKRIAHDGSTCIDFIQEKPSFVACFFTKRLSETAESNGFFRYADLSEEGKHQIQPLRPNAVVYVEGYYGWLYQTDQRRLGEFSVYESNNVLCRDDSTNLGQPATCYVAALDPLSTSAQPLSIFIAATIEKPPGPIGKISLAAQRRIDAIHGVIKTIRIVGTGRNG